MFNFIIIFFDFFLRTEQQSFIDFHFYLTRHTCSSFFVSPGNSTAILKHQREGRQSSNSDQCSWWLAMLTFNDKEIFNGVACCLLVAVHGETSTVTMFWYSSVKLKPWFVYDWDGDWENERIDEDWEEDVEKLCSCRQNRSPVLSSLI